MDPDWKLFVKGKKELYEKLEGVTCPAFGNEKVCFTSAGFRHFIRKNGVLRPREQQERRFNLLPQVPAILSNSFTATTYFQDYSGQSVIHYWSFTSIQNEKNITVVVRQVNSNPKHFYSVFDEDLP
jgi:hypothetical protein